MEKIKAYYNKDNFDHTQGLVNPYEYHKTFFFLLRCFGVVHTEPPSLFSAISIGYMKVTTVMSICITMFSVYNGLSNFELPLITEAGTYTIVLSYKLLILSCAGTNIEYYHHLLKTMAADFEYVCTKGSKYREMFFKNQLITWKMCITIITFIMFIANGMIIFATGFLIYFHLTYDESKEWKRPLLFPFWMWQVDFYKTPLYEISFIYSNVSVFLYGYNYLFMLQTQIVWIRHITAKADIVIWSIHDLFGELQPARNAEETQYYEVLIKSRMSEIIKQHQSMNDLLAAYAGIYKKMLMFEQKACCPVVCLTCYCTAEKMDKGEFNAILVLLCVAAIVNIFIPSYLCTFLVSKVNSICDACWGCDFWNAGSVIRPYMVLMMQRSLRPLPLQAAGFEDVTIETFSKKMTSAYSCFNMLRQTNL